MRRPLLIIINGLPGAGKTTLAKRLGRDLALPVLCRDEIVETLFDALDCPTHGRPSTLGNAGFQLLHYCAGQILSTGQDLIVEASMMNATLASGEFLQLQRVHDFRPLQVSCYASGDLLRQRFLRRAGSSERHICHRDLEFVALNGARFVAGRCEPLELDGPFIEFDTSDPQSYDYAGLLSTLRAALRSE
ncbi:AAA family ATPase [Dictyobacter aurantiacus]|uniref:Kinase n=1 Tax=Dictyobacter aurantiacus TaxID=1936993 RepID=A0A401ZKG2_9CHLR|nr:AAA family ATPase [Dictyobacter aurantiacus]GCE07310.1 hypothetical protein KDAU_46390 [Dictyobacter aurantiacus]